MDDQTLTLVERARTADPDAVDELFRRYREPLRRGLRKMVGDSYRLRIADSEDATQDAILSALGSIREFEYRGEGSFLGWLLKRAEFEILGKIRARNAARRGPQSGPVVDLETADPSATDRSISGQVNQAELNEKLRACLNELPTRERDIIYLRRFMEVSIQDICTEMDLSTPSAARNLLARAQARLTGVLAKHGLRGDAI